MRAALLENARFPYHTILELWKQYDIRARCCWSRAGPVKIATKRCHSFAVKHDYKRDRRADCSLVNPEVKASDVFLFGLHPMKPEISGGLRGLQTGSESITHAFVWSSEPQPRDHLLSSEEGIRVSVWSSPKKMRPRGLSGGTGSKSIRRAFSSLKMIPRDRLCGL